MSPIAASGNLKNQVSVGGWAQTVAQLHPLQPRIQLFWTSADPALGNIAPLSLFSDFASYPVPWTP